jgi:hypothetical protein
MSKLTGKANSFQSDFLNANMKGTNFKGSKVSHVSQKYIYTEDGTQYSKKGVNVCIDLREETLSMIRPDICGDTEGDRC